MDNCEFFLNTDMSKHIGDWLAIVDEKIVASGKNAKDVYRQAKEHYPSKTPMLTCVPKGGAMIF
jgi:hypothetical protein